jgi:hypothetical protein
VNEELKLLLALQQIDNLMSLLKFNEYENNIYSHLISVKTELKRQLTILTHSSKIKE